MRSSSPLLASLALAGFLALGLAAPAWAGTPISVEVKKARGDWHIGSESVRVRNEQKNVFIRARSNGGDQTVSLHHDSCCSPAEDDFRTRYFDKRTGENVTSAVKGSGHPFELQGGESRAFRIQIKPINPTTSVFCVFPHFTTDSQQFPGYFSVNSPTGCV